jgi:hypothetical protein
MKRTVLAIGACVCAAALVAAAMAQQGQTRTGSAYAPPASTAEPESKPGSEDATKESPYSSKGVTTDISPPKTPVSLGEKTPAEKAAVESAVGNVRVNLNLHDVTLREAETLLDRYRRAAYGMRQPDNLVNELVGKWKAAQSDSDRGKAEQELREALKKEFQARLGSHEKEIEELEAHVKQLREKLDLHRKRQDDIVRFRMQQLLREAQGLGWGPETGTRPSIKHPTDMRALLRPAMVFEPSADQWTPPGTKSSGGPSDAGGKATPSEARPYSKPSDGPSDDEGKVAAAVAPL